MFEPKREGHCAAGRDGSRQFLATCLPLRPQWLPAGLDGQAVVTPVLTRVSGLERAGRRLRTGRNPLWKPEGGVLGDLGPLSLLPQKPQSAPVPGAPAVVYHRGTCALPSAGAGALTGRLRWRGGTDGVASCREVGSTWAPGSPRQTQPCKSGEVGCGAGLCQRAPTLQPKGTSFFFLKGCLGCVCLGPLAALQNYFTWLLRYSDR